MTTEIVQCLVKKRDSNPELQSNTKLQYKHYFKVKNQTVEKCFLEYIFKSILGRLRSQWKCCTYEARSIDGDRLLRSKKYVLIMVGYSAFYIPH